MARFDIVEALVVLAGKLQARRVARLKRREAALKAAIIARCKALTATQKERQTEQAHKLLVS